MIIAALALRAYFPIAFAFGRVMKLRCITLKRYLLQSRSNIELSLADKKSDKEIAKLFDWYIGDNDLKKKCKSFADDITFFIPHFTRVLRAQIREKSIHPQVFNMARLTLFLINGGMFGANAAEYLATICDHHLSSLRWFVQYALERCEDELVGIPEFRIFADAASLMTECPVSPN
ncbi:MAG: hypothetical protein M0R33_13825 [Methylomonas sp.]|jgi:hypothetical protein|uniref:hypothetical protein n=1 Tax=Methylomonas sp. TaxID=418 RepID=UPI0025D62D93|nr:hypothetical protein [Methylomonas sp.]MCK9607514.1 hypothetical protein [Methylomonas sp.]